MNTNGHTPGPWTAQLSRTDGYIMKGAFCVASVGDCCEPRDANARLIAAAPELLAALELFESITRTPELNGHLPVFLREFEQAARAAIAKATS